MKRIKSRLTIFEKVYHQRPGEQPRGFEAGYDRTLESKELPYIRELVVGSDWTPIDGGWIERAGMIRIKNEEAAFVHTVPSNDEIAEAMSRVVIVGVAQPSAYHGRSTPIDIPVFEGFILRPQETFRAEPAALENLRLRCRFDTARCTLAVIPA